MTAEIGPNPLLQAGGGTEGRQHQDRAAQGMMSSSWGWHGPMLVGLVIAVMVAGTGCAYQGDVKARAWAKAEAEPVATVFGCYAYAHTLGGVENWRKHVKLMKAYGMNTVALAPVGPQDIAAQLDIMVEEEMLESSIAMFLLDHSVAEHYKQVVPN